MRASRYMIFLYAAMVGVPLLLYLRLISSAYGMRLISTLLLALASFGLVVFGILGFAEVFVHGRYRVEGIRMPLHPASLIAASNRETGRRESAVVNFRVNRFNEEKKSMEEKVYRVEADKNSTVLGALIGIKEGEDPTLSIRYSCRMGICGSCGMVVNGKPSLACETNVFERMLDKEITVEPMYGHPLLRDLVTDFDDFFERHLSIKPGLYRLDKKEKYAAHEPYKQSREDIDKFLPYSYCIMCGLCLDACPVVNSNPDFIGPQALSQVYRYHADSLDQKGAKRLLEVDKLDGVWGCEFAGACSKVCPKGVDPAGAIQLLKGELMKGIVDDKEG